MGLAKGENRNDPVYYGYLCLMRPPMPGAVPREGLTHCEEKDDYSISGHHYWGRVVYNRKLTENEIRHYDLEPTALATLD